MANSKDSNDGCATGVGVVFVGGVALISAVPKSVWITLGVIAMVVFLIWGAYRATTAYGAHKAAAEERARAEQAARAAAAKREQEEKARQRREQLVASLGDKNATLVARADVAAKRIAATEAARDGWLGDVDFRPDIRGITEHFQRAHELQQVANQLSGLDRASADDRKILAEAKTTIARLEAAAGERVDLISRCAAEAQLIDDSLRQERKDARTAEQRADLHAKLSAMLYGIEATPDVTLTNSAADSVMARVQAYREIKNAIQQIRDSGSRP